MLPDESEPIGERSAPGHETRLRIELGSVSAARHAVARALDGQVGQAEIGGAQLLVSELVTNSVRHSGASATQVIVVRVELTATVIRVEVDDPGRSGNVSRRAPDVEQGGGFGLNLVHALAERWGSQAVPGGGTRVWAELARGVLGPAAATA
jgi:anti-sigma regulatory factor (Ser/Thr protein kinase)